MVNNGKKATPWFNQEVKDAVQATNVASAKSFWHLRHPEANVRNPHDEEVQNVILKEFQI